MGGERAHQCRSKSVRPSSGWGWCWLQGAAAAGTAVQSVSHSVAGRCKPHQCGAEQLHHWHSVAAAAACRLSSTTSCSRSSTHGQTLLARGWSAGLRQQRRRNMGSQAGACELQSACSHSSRVPPCQIALDRAKAQAAAPEQREAPCQLSIRSLPQCARMGHFQDKPVARAVEIKAGLPAKHSLLGVAGSWVWSLLLPPLRHQVGLDHSLARSSLA